MSEVPEDPHLDEEDRVSDILTNPTSGTEVHVILLTELVLLTSVLSVTCISRHHTILNTVAQ